MSGLARATLSLFQFCQIFLLIELQINFILVVIFIICVSMRSLYFSHFLLSEQFVLCIFFNRLAEKVQYHDDFKSDELGS
jgi:hypothetical protein